MLQPAKHYEATALLRGSAFLFIICGSALAVSAAGVLLVIGLVTSESGTNSTLVRGAFHGTLVGAIFADAVFLVFGYNDIAAAFGWHPVLWTLVAAVALAIPVFLAVLCEPQACLTKKLYDQVCKRVKGMVGAAFAELVIMPVVFFRIWFRHGFDGRRSYGSALGPLLFTCGCAFWAGVAFAAFIWISRTKVDSQRIDPVAKKPTDAGDARVLGDEAPDGAAHDAVAQPETPGPCQESQALTGEAAMRASDTVASDTVASDTAAGPSD